MTAFFYPWDIIADITIAIDITKTGTIESKIV